MIDAQLRLERPAFTLDVALALPQRGVSALFGASGCGKTTVLRALAGLERAAGHVRLGDEIWQDDARGIFVPTHRRAIGYVIQQAALFPQLDVQANLGYGMRRVGAAGRRVELAPIVAMLGIGHLLARRPATLSGGERQRVAIARALASSPRLLLLDEPLAALDAARKAELLPYLERLQAELSIPLVYVSHAIDEVARLADHVVLLADGRVTGSGALNELLSRLDPPLPLGDDAGVVLHARIAERDERWQLARLDVPAAAGGVDCSLWARDPGQPLGHAVRLRVLARDVSLAASPQTGSSIGNQLHGVLEALADDAHPALALARVRIGSTPLIARLTRRSAHALELQPGRPVWALVKSVALLE